MLWINILWNLFYFWPESVVPTKLGLNSLSNPAILKLQNAVTEWSNCICGKMIPNLKFNTIKGKRYINSDLRGKVLVINFWFKACAPCVAEMPSLNKLRNEFKDKNVLFIGFSSDTDQTLKSAYLNPEKFLFEIVPNSREIEEKFFFYGAGYPTTYIVDQNGRIVKTWTGYSIFTGEPYDIAKPIINQLLSHRKN
jgi:peroxiredoxin